MAAQWLLLSIILSALRLTTVLGRTSANLGGFVSSHEGNLMLDQSVVFTISCIKFVFAIWIYFNVVSFFLCPINSCSVAIDIPLSILWVPKVCLRVCTLTFFLIPAFLTYFATRC